MAGLFNLFGSQKNTAESQAPQQSGDAFYLDFDQAQTMGNLDYMRSTKSVKRTYAKSVSQPDEVVEVKQVSANGMKRILEKEGMTSVTSTNGNGMTTESVQSFQPKSAEVEARRKTDTSMDMFRNMAKGMRKG